MAEPSFNDEQRDRLVEIMVTLRGELELLRMRLASGGGGLGTWDLQRLVSEHAELLAAGLEGLGSTTGDSDRRRAALDLLGDLAQVERELSRTSFR